MPATTTTTAAAASFNATTAINLLLWLGLPGHAIYGRVRNGCEFLEVMYSVETGSVERASGAVMWAAEKQIDAAAISALGFDKAAVEAVECFETGDMLQLKDNETLEFSSKDPSIVAVLGAVLRPGFPVPFACSVLKLVKCGLGPEAGKAIASALATNATITQVRASLLLFYTLFSKLNDDLFLFFVVAMHCIQLDISSNSLGADGGKAIAASIAENITITSVSYQLGYV